MRQTLEKKAVALRQLDAALQLFETGGDHLAVITLAGAAEEILGKLILLAGGTPSLDHLVQATCAIHKLQTGQDLDQTTARSRANAARNALKHLDGPPDLSVSLDPEEEAVDMLDRAVTNYWVLEGALSPAMQRFTPPRRAT